MNDLSHREQEAGCAREEASNIRVSDKQFPMAIAAGHPAEDKLLAQVAAEEAEFAQRCQECCSRCAELLTIQENMFPGLLDCQASMARLGAVGTTDVDARIMAMHELFCSEFAPSNSQAGAYAGDIRSIIIKEEMMAVFEAEGDERSISPVAVGIAALAEPLLLHRAPCQIKDRVLSELLVLPVELVTRRRKNSKVLLS